MSAQNNNPLLNEFREGQTLLRVQNPTDLRGRQLPLAVEVTGVTSSNDSLVSVEFRTAEKCAAYRVGEQFYLPIEKASRYYPCAQPA